MSEFVRLVDCDNNHVGKTFSEEELSDLHSENVESGSGSGEDPYVIVIPSFFEDHISCIEKRRVYRCAWFTEEDDDGCFRLRGSSYAISLPWIKHHCWYRIKNFTDFVVDEYGFFHNNDGPAISSASGEYVYIHGTLNNNYTCMGIDHASTLEPLTTLFAVNGDFCESREEYDRKMDLFLAKYPDGAGCDIDVWQPYLVKFAKKL